MDNKQLERIEKWIKGAMPPDEADVFEKELKSNPELFNQAKLVRLTQLAFQKQAQIELQEKIKASLAQKRKNDRKKSLMGLVILFIAVLIGGYFWLKPKSTQGSDPIPTLQKPMENLATNSAAAQDNNLTTSSPTNQTPTPPQKPNYKGRIASLVQQEIGETITETYFKTIRGGSNRTNKDSLLAVGLRLSKTNTSTDSIVQIFFPLGRRQVYMFDVLGQSHLFHGKYEQAYVQFDSLEKLSRTNQQYAQYKKLQCATALYDQSPYNMIADTLLNRFLRNNNPKTRSAYYVKALHLKKDILNK